MGDGRHRKGGGPRWLLIGGGAVAACGAVVLLTLPGGGHPPPAAVRSRPAPVPAEVTAAPADAALAYLRHRNPHVKKIAWTGEMLRVYTDLPESDANSRPAVTLCEVAASYLRTGGHDPVVFVHAARDANGYVVIANKMDDRDPCTLNVVP